MPQTRPLWLVWLWTASSGLWLFGSLPSRKHNSSSGVRWVKTHTRQDTLAAHVMRQSWPPGANDKRGDRAARVWRQTEGQASFNGVFWPECFLGQRACWPPHPAWNNITFSQQPASLSPHDTQWFPEKSPWRRNYLLSAKKEKIFRPLSSLAPADTLIISAALAQLR